MRPPFHSIDESLIINHFDIVGARLQVLCLVFIRWEELGVCGGLEYNSLELIKLLSELYNLYPVLTPVYSITIIHNLFNLQSSLSP